MIPSWQHADTRGLSTKSAVRYCSLLETILYIDMPPTPSLLASLIHYSSISYSHAQNIIKLKMSGFFNAIGLVSGALTIVSFTESQLPDNKPQGPSIRIKGRIQFKVVSKTPPLTGYTF